MTLATSWPRTECRSCHKPVFWATFGSGKSMMVNYEPDPDGNLDVLADVHGEPRIQFVEADEVALPGMAVARYVSHFATCVHAKLWRKDSKGRFLPPRIG